MTAVRTHQTARDTETAAAVQVGRIVSTLRDQVEAVLIAWWPEGLTDDEGGALLDADRLHFGRRRHELCLMGRVVDSGERRNTPTGHKAIVWRLAQAPETPSSIGDPS